MLCIFERRRLRMSYSSVHNNDAWRARYSTELYTLCDELAVVKVRWLGSHFRMQELDPCRKLTVLQQEGSRLSWGGLSQLRKI